MNLLVFLWLIRIESTAVYLLSILAGAHLVGETFRTPSVQCSLIAFFFCVSASFALSDYFDRKADAINLPYRPNTKRARLCSIRTWIWSCSIHTRSVDVFVSRDDRVRLCYSSVPRSYCVLPLHQAGAGPQECLYCVAFLGAVHVSCCGGKQRRQERIAVLSGCPGVAGSRSDNGHA
jgi:hypothetical protein